MSASLLLTVREIHEIHVYDRSNFHSLSDAKAGKAVYTVNIEELTGNLHNTGSLCTAMQLVDTVLKCVGHSTANLCCIVTDAQGRVVDCT